MLYIMEFSAVHELPCVLECLYVLNADLAVIPAIVYCIMVRILNNSVMSTRMHCNELVLIRLTIIIMVAIMTIQVRHERLCIISHTHPIYFARLSICMHAIQCSWHIAVFAVRAQSKTP